MRIPSSLVLVPALLLSACRPTTEESAAPPRSAVEELSSRQREIRSHEIHPYRIVLAPGVFLHAVVDQQGVDVQVALLDPDGETLFEIDSPNVDHGPEPVFVVAEKNGPHVLEVRSPSASGRYALSVEARRPATEQDEWLAAAARAVVEGDGLRRRNRPEAFQGAVGKYREALALWRQAGNRQGEATTLSRIGLAFHGLPDPGRAVAGYRQACSLFRELGERREEARYLHQSAGLHRSLGELAEARNAYRRALALFRELADREREATLLNDLALFYKRTGETHEALRHYEEALELWRILGARNWEATTLNNIGELYILLGRIELAFDVLHEALPLREPGSQGQAVTLSSLGTAYRRSGQLNDALDCFRRALKLRRDLDDGPGEAVTLNSLGLTYVKLDDADKARDAYHRTLEIFRRHQDPRGEAYVLVNLGALLDQQGESAAAIRLYRQALPLLQRLGDRSGEASAFFSIALARSHLGETGAARDAVEEAIRRIEALRTLSPGEDLSESYFASKKHYYELYVELLMRLHEAAPDDGYDALGLHASERSRARGLLELLWLAHVDLYADLDPELREREREVRSRLDREQRAQRAERAATSSDQRIAELDREIRTLLAEYHRVQAEIHDRSPRAVDLASPRPPDLAEIQRDVLDDDTLLLEFALGERRSFLWLVGNRSLTSYPLPARSEIEDLARESVARLVRSPNRGGRISAELMAARLGEVVLGPVAERLGTRRLLVVADGALRYVPFAALTLPGESRPLVVDHEIVHLPSASALAMMRRQVAGRPPAPRSIAVLADPVFRADDPRVQPARRRSHAAVAARYGENLDRLPGSREEAETILSLVPDDQAFIALDFDANRQVVLDGELNLYRILHFATHSLVDMRHPELSRIVLSQVDEHGRPREGSLHLHEIYALDLPADLIVLSACRTAWGKVVRGEGMVGLTRGFMHAGAARVLVSYWDVHDRGTSELMKRFYRALFEDGLSPAAALRAAQISMLGDEHWGAPFYWAGFALQGEWR